MAELGGTEKAEGGDGRGRRMREGEVRRRGREMRKGKGGQNDREEMGRKGSGGG